MGNKKKILIIDDDTDCLSSLRAALESKGFDVIAAISGEEGFRLFEEHGPDFVLTDIMMEKIDTGIRLVRKIREKNKYVPIYLLSDIGRITAENINIYGLGCTGSLQKPCNPEELLRVIEQETAKNK